MSNQEKHGLVNFTTRFEMDHFKFILIDEMGFVEIPAKEEKTPDPLQEFGPIIKVEIVDLEVPAEVPVTIIEEKRVIRIDEMTWEDHKRGVANLHARFGLEMFN